MKKFMGIMVVMMVAALVFAGTAMADVAEADRFINKITDQVGSSFVGQFQRARDYEIAFLKQDNKALPWTARCDVLNEKNLFGWRKTALRRVFPWMIRTEDAPSAGWSEFMAASVMANPQGWVMELTPRDTTLAGFEKMTITADQRNIVSVEFK